VVITGPNGVPRSIIGLVDSGADSSLFPVQWASEFGIDLAQCRDANGSSAAGKTTYYEWPGGLHATTAGERLRLAAVFGSTPFVLLGRDDFFAHFRVAFDQQAMTFEVSPHAPLRS
jgi:hypothetical protein